MGFKGVSSNIENAEGAFGTGLRKLRRRIISRAKRSQLIRTIWQNRYEPAVLVRIAIRKASILARGGAETTRLPLVKAFSRELELSKEPSSHGEIFARQKVLRGLIEESASLVEISGAAPEVSVIISAHNQLRVTLLCLESVLKSASRASLEIIVVYDESDDETKVCIGALPRIRLAARPAVGEFTHSRNDAAALARGEFILFLRSDTYVLTDWLNELLGTLRSNPRIGLVGSKFISPDGGLREAGGIIWSDGSLSSYGSGARIDRPELNYTRSVDYCSAAPILINRNLFLDLGGFSRALSQASYEDADLALKVRARGLQVIYQPRSVVMQLEGKSSGADSSQDLDAYKEGDREVFLNRWRDSLKLHGLPGADPAGERDRGFVGRVLFVDACIPTPDRDAGSVVSDSWIQTLLALGYHVAFIAVHQFVELAGYTERLERMGVFCPRAPYAGSIEQFLAENAHRFTGIAVCRHECADLVLNCMAKANLDIPIVFLPIDLHYLRETRRADLQNSVRLKQNSLITKNLELDVVKRASLTCVHSLVEKEILLSEVPRALVETSPIIFPVPGRKAPFEARSDICFIGGFKHTPNIDAVAYFASEVLPLIIAELPDLKLKIVGPDAPPAVASLASKAIEILGFVPDLNPLFSSIKLSVAPLRYGAGAKGKVGLSMAHGVPVVGTQIAFEGMNLADNEEVLFAEDPEQFARKVVEIYRDADLWYKISDGAVKRAAAEYSPEANAPLISALLRKAGITAHESGESKGAWA